MINSITILFNKIFHIKKWGKWNQRNYLIRLKITTSTWLTESYNLYDYEATQLSCQNLNINTTGQLMRTRFLILDSQIYFNEKELFDPLIKYNCINYSLLAVIEIIDGFFD